MGRAIVSSQDFAKPIQVQIKELESISTTTSRIVDKKDIRTLCLKYYQQSYKRGVIPGLEACNTRPDIYQVEEYLSIKLTGFVKAWVQLCENLTPNSQYIAGLKAVLENNGLADRSEFVSNFVIAKLYKEENGLSFAQRAVYITDFLKRVLEGGGDISRQDRAMLRIRRTSLD